MLSLRIRWIKTFIGIKLLIVHKTIIILNRVILNIIILLHERITVCCQKITFLILENAGISRKKCWFKVSSIFSGKYLFISWQDLVNEQALEKDYLWLIVFLNKQQFAK